MLTATGMLFYCPALKAISEKDMPLEAPPIPLFFHELRERQANRHHGATPLVVIGVHMVWA